MTVHQLLPLIIGFPVALAAMALFLFACRPRRDEEAAAPPAQDDGRWMHAHEAPPQVGGGWGEEPRRNAYW